ncbi:small ribosomal subunit protein uS10m isoform X10 [Ovis aries]|uniref:small ribosomal subunit protein uS10m isoform X10 n=1 Tax=Ovis aries TaxID=9940 RepID=UPI001C2E1C23|nr:small ribosomal subunit protein uS10m isoform X10 [Ovis aries]
MVRGRFCDPGGNPGEQERQDGGASCVWGPGPASLAVPMSCLFCHLMNCRPPDSSVHGIFQGSRNFSVSSSRSSIAKNDGFLLTSMKWVQFSNLHVDVPKDLTKPTLEHLTGSTADVYLEYIQRNLPEGVAMEVTKTRLEQLPEHIKKPIWETTPEEKETASRKVPQ